MVRNFSFPPSLVSADNCDRPACADIVSALNAAVARSAANTNDDDDAATATTTVECPPDSGRLGRGTWNLLHSVAAWYPDRPSEDDRTAARNLVAALARFYPCTYCAEDFRSNVNDNPVKTASREELSQWLCEQHNVVNEKLGKKRFPCDMKSLDERWRISSHPVCNGGGDHDDDHDGKTSTAPRERKWKTIG